MQVLPGLVEGGQRRLQIRPDHWRTQQHLQQTRRWSGGFRDWRGKTKKSRNLASAQPFAFQLQAQPLAGQALLQAFLLEALFDPVSVGVQLIAFACFPHMHHGFLASHWNWRWSQLIAFASFHHMPPAVMLLEFCQTSLSLPREMSAVGVPPCLSVLAFQGAKKHKRFK